MIEQIPCSHCPGGWAVKYDEDNIRKYFECQSCKYVTIEVKL